MTGLKPLRMQAETELECQIMPGDSASNLVGTATSGTGVAAAAIPSASSEVNRAISRKYCKGSKGAKKPKRQMRPRAKKRKQVLGGSEPQSDSSDPVPTDESDIEERRVYFGPKEAIRSLADVATDSDEDVILTDYSEPGI